ncbi:MAG: 2'-5' RNA ligase family protein [Gammaproteobacteria bacterium]|nr:2'-5' RNA ligase family protein [Gammaproteobacteria bacterium]
MKNRYNIALIPTAKSEAVVRFAKTFSAFSDRYQLGLQSLPHVTLCQFAAEESELLSLWREVSRKIKPKTVRLHFNEISGTRSSRAFWVSLLPDKAETLTKMHYAIADIIRHPLNHSYENYFPHMSLINSQDEKVMDAIKKAEMAYAPIEDDFILSLGRSDKVGQYIEVIYT